MSKKNFESRFMTRKEYFDKWKWTDNTTYKCSLCEGEFYEILEIKTPYECEDFICEKCFIGDKNEN